MNFRNRSAEEPELNFIPLIDVLLMTLIFLVVTTSFATESQLRIQLPEASADARLDQRAMRVAIDARGHYYVNNMQLLDNSPEVLRRAMKKAAGDNRDPMVMLYADGKAPHEAVVRAMDSARRLGYVRLTFATQQPANDGKP